MPSPSVLQLFELVMDPVLITNCMADYLNENETQNCGKFDNMAMEYINKCREQETKIVKERRKARKKLIGILLKKGACAWGLNFTPASCKGFRVVSVSKIY